MERKETVKALAEHFGVKPKYMGAPSFAYQIETREETYIIDRVGSIKNSKGDELTLESILSPEQVELEIETEIEAEAEAEAGTEMPNKPEDLPINGFEVAIPFEAHTAITLWDLGNMLSSK